MHQRASLSGSQRSSRCGQRAAVKCRKSSQAQPPRAVRGDRGAAMARHLRAIHAQDIEEVRREVLGEGCTTDAEERAVGRRRRRGHVSQLPMDLQGNTRKACKKQHARCNAHECIQPFDRISRKGQSAATSSAKPRAAAPQASAVQCHAAVSHGVRHGIALQRRTRSECDMLYDTISESPTRRRTRRTPPCHQQCKGTDRRRTDARTAYDL